MFRDATGVQRRHGSDVSTGKNILFPLVYYDDVYYLCKTLKITIYENRKIHQIRLGYEAHASRKGQLRNFGRSAHDRIQKVNDFHDKPTNLLEEWMYYLSTGGIPQDSTAPGLSEAREKLKLQQIDHHQAYS